MKKKSLLPFILKRAIYYLAIYLAGVGGGFLIIRIFVEPEITFDGTGFAILFTSLYMFSDLVKMGAQFGYDRKSLLKTHLVLIAFLSLTSGLVANISILLGESRETFTLIKQVYGQHALETTQILALIFVLECLLALASCTTGLALQTLHMRIGKFKFFRLLGLVGAGLAALSFYDGQPAYYRLSGFVEWLVRSPVNLILICLVIALLMATIAFPLFKKAPIGLQSGAV